MNPKSAPEQSELSAGGSNTTPVLKLEIVTPGRKVFASAASSVVLPARNGLVEILPGHIPLTTLLAPGEVIVTDNARIERLVIDKGIARVHAGTISILTEAAIDTDAIDLKEVEEKERRAAEALDAARKNGADDPSVDTGKLLQILRFSAAQRLLKKRG
jgi:F-type H+-transporting ATPase subunit epsilon